MKNVYQSQSLWMSGLKLPVRHTLMESLQADVAIVGGGITGLTCAYLLSKQGKKVVLLTQGIGDGETLRTTGHLTAILDTRFHELEKKFGLESSLIAAESHKNAIDFIETVTFSETISCEFERVPAYLFATRENSQEIQQELEASKRAGMHVSMLLNAPLSFETGKCLQFEDQAQFSPGKYIIELVDSIEKNGGQIFGNTHVSRFEDGKKAKIKTLGGPEVQADAIIVATNTPVNNRVMMHTKQTSYRSYAIAGKIAKGSVFRALYYDTLDPYHYVRLAKHPKTHEEYLIIGGEDHKTGQNKHPERCYENLENWAREHFPSLHEIEYRWSGQIVEPVDGVGYLGKNPLGKNIYISTGYSGNGLTYASLGAILITDAISQQKDSQKLFAPRRKAWNSLGEFSRENLNTFAQYIDWLKPMAKNKPKAGHGAIVKKQGKKMAVFHDEHDETHAFSAVCPHLGAILRWNAAEKTWDCPAHGSRFSCTGKVLNGPACGNLKKCAFEN
jgi:glycine/D-amino acid oxidase-like deaminating enzyme/nitrite reductase/ring-hydroxylating ferredoxin subunit